MCNTNGCWTYHALSARVKGSKEIGFLRLLETDATPQGMSIIVFKDAPSGIIHDKQVMVSA